MDWHELSANWDAMADSLLARFPSLDLDLITGAPRDSRALTHHIANSHELTVEEARDALQEFLKSEGLTRRACADPGLTVSGQRGDPEDNSILG